MLAYVMQFSLTILYIRGSKNLLPDALSRLWQDSSSQERKKHEATYMHEPEDFVLAITRAETARQQQSFSDKSNPSSARPLNPYAKVYNPIKCTQTRPKCVDECVKISERNTNGYDNDSIREDVGRASCVKSYRHENVDSSGAGADTAPVVELVSDAAGAVEPPGCAAPDLWPTPAWLACDTPVSLAPREAGEALELTLPPQSAAGEVTTGTSGELGAATPLYDMTVSPCTINSEAGTTFPVHLTPLGELEVNRSDDISTDLNREARPTETDQKDTTDGQQELRGSADQSLLSDKAAEEVVNFPTISSSDYETDEEFGAMYQYLKHDILTGRARLDKTILIMAERHLIDVDGLLYRIDIPRQKKLAK